jgi:hypothetical protein
MEEFFSEANPADVIRKSNIRVIARERRSRNPGGAVEYRIPAFAGMTPEICPAP